MKRWLTLAAIMLAIPVLTMGVALVDPVTTKLAGTASYSDADTVVASALKLRKNWTTTNVLITADSVKSDTAVMYVEVAFSADGTNYTAYTLVETDSITGAGLTADTTSLGLTVNQWPTWIRFRFRGDTLNADADTAWIEKIELRYR